MGPFAARNPTLQRGLRLGRLLPFRRGFERIMQDVDAPIIPVSLDGVWGSIFSYEGGRFVWKVPRTDSLSGFGGVWQGFAARRYAISGAAIGAGYAELTRFNIAGRD